MKQEIHLACNISCFVLDKRLWACYSVLLSGRLECYHLIYTCSSKTYNLFPYKSPIWKTHLHNGLLSRDMYSLPDLLCLTKHQSYPIWPLWQSGRHGTYSYGPFASHIGDWNKNEAEFFGQPLQMSIIFIKLVRADHTRRLITYESVFLPVCLFWPQLSYFPAQ